MNINIPILGIKDIPESKVIETFLAIKKGQFPRLPDALHNREQEWKDGWVKLAHDHFNPASGRHLTITQLRTTRHTDGECEDPHYYGDNNALYDVDNYPHPPGRNPCSCLSHVRRVRSLVKLHPNLEGTHMIKHSKLERLLGRSALINFPNDQTLWAELYDVMFKMHIEWGVVTESTLVESARNKSFKRGDEYEDADGIDVKESLFLQVTVDDHLIIYSEGALNKKAEAALYEAISTRNQNGLKTWLCAPMNTTFSNDIQKSIRLWESVALTNIV